MRKEHGFTLIELSVVLVIIGLIAGGILVGGALIDAARIRNAYGQIQEYETAISAFRIKYDTLPGDMPHAKAVSLGFQPRNTVTCSNDQFIYPACDSSFITWHMYSESLLFWRDLSEAGLISNVFRLATEGGVGALTQAQVGDYVPASKLDGNFILFGTWYYNQGGGQNGILPNVPYTYYMITSITGTNGNQMYMPLGITTATAAAFDKKFDDGDPTRGVIQAADMADFAGDLIEPNSNWLNVPGGCLGATGNPARYNTSRTDPACRLIIFSKAWPN